MVLRSIAVCGQMIAIALSTALGIILPLFAMASVIAALVLLNGWIWLQLRAPRQWGQAAVAAQLGFDLVSFALLIYLSGGTDNPFCLLFVLHSALLALLLPLKWAAVGIVAVITSFAVLSRIRLPLEMKGAGPVPTDLLVFGQWLSFALTAGITAWFVLRIVGSLRDHDRELARAAQIALRDEAVLRVGALAAGAAHELATPLTTMAVTAGEILRNAQSPAVKRDAEILASQVGICREKIADLLAAGGHARSVGGGRERLDIFLESIAERCRTIHPEARIASNWDQISPAPEIFSEQALRQSLLALLSNAVDASPRDVEFSGRKEGNIARLAIADRGPGLPTTDTDKLGRSFFTTKRPGDGAGLGLIIARRTIERLGGAIRWTSRDGGGVLVEVEVPLDALLLGKPLTPGKPS